ncbi:unnamed protein product [Haemonchus placei]|uniref:TORC_M domain-containing protein n=1 Tax=Haemonchus placei TaxID=6290 RepID=A0A0N4X3U3_HAEPC|nr:unnamed protein product [Haemonchus placei]
MAKNMLEVCAILVGMTLLEQNMLHYGDAKPAHGWRTTARQPPAGCTKREYAIAPTITTALSHELWVNDVCDCNISRYPNGSPMQSPMGSPMGSSLILDERTTPMMELSPPGMHDPCSEAGSLPNLQHHGMTPHQQPPPYYHQTVGQRHSTGGALVGAPRLAPTTRTPESQSAPTSPANNLDPSQQLQWHGTRTFSNSPESLDIPRLVLTNPEGTNGPHLECFNDLQHITLDANDMEMLCNGTGNGIPVQQVGQFLL